MLHLYIYIQYLLYVYTCIESGHFNQITTIQCFVNITIYRNTFIARSHTVLFIAGSSGDSSLRRSKQMTTSMVNLSGNSNSKFVNSLRKHPDFGMLIRSWTTSFLFIFYIFSPVPSPQTKFLVDGFKTGNCLLYV